MFIIGRDAQSAFQIRKFAASDKGGPGRQIDAARTCRVFQDAGVKEKHYAPGRCHRPSQLAAFGKNPHNAAHGTKDS
jgi:hypothetical protein